MTPSPLPVAWNPSIARHRLSELGLGGGSSKTTPRQASLRAKGRSASVLVLLSSDGWVLLTLRSKKLKSHPGQVSLPGGKQDQADQHDDVVTALRETHEEVGLDLRSAWPLPCLGTRFQQQRKKQQQGEIKNETEIDSNGVGLEILCTMPTTEAIGNLCVVPVVGLYASKPWKELHEELVVSEDEVDTAFWAPLTVFADGSEHLTERYDVPDWPVPGETFVYRSYDYGFPQTGQRFAITGLTADILHSVASVVYSKDSGGSETSNNETAESHNAIPEHPSEKRGNNPSLPPLRGTLRRRTQRDGGRRPSRGQWKEAFFVLLSNQGGSSGGGILHRYDSVQHALRKEQAANKKNRLRLMPNTSGDDSLVSVQILPRDEDEQNDDETGGGSATPHHYPFAISTLNGRLRWELSAASPEERAKWVERIESIGNCRSSTCSDQPSKDRTNR